MKRFILIMVLISAVEAGQPPSGILLSGGAGYFHTAGGVTSVWTAPGISATAELGFLNSKGLGFSFSGVLGGNYMVDSMKDSVHGSWSDNSGSETLFSTGGRYQGIQGGVLYGLPMPGKWYALLSAGGMYYGQAETGMEAVADWGARWTFGWGGYAGFKICQDLRTMYNYGFGVKLSYARANMNEFYFDHRYGKMSYKDIPPVYENDFRIEVNAMVGIKMKL